MNKKYSLFYILIVLFVVALATTFISAYLTDEKKQSTESTIGEVRVTEVDVYYMNGTTKVPYSLVTIGSGATLQTKEGVYDVDIYDESNPYHIKNLHVDIYVKANVKAYLRVAINDQIVRKVTNYQNIVNETAIRHDPIEFNFNSANWHKQVHNNDARSTYYYYKTKLVDATSAPIKVSFIIPKDVFSYLVDGHQVYINENYSLQLGFRYEVVQADFGGPEHNWGLQTPPWGGNW
ncbi:MAG: hypothetical protein GX232_03830 [Acholeplasmataceae bacterium]|jgi:hypothetical protein|nr:hypothetical protein [Acholeplasmataceae bacterium]